METLVETMKRVAPGYYTERDGADWYIVVPEHDDRIAEDFVKRESAQRFMIWLAGNDPLPKDWTITGIGGIAADLNIPDQYGRATIWTRTIKRRFPGRLEALGF